ncbi:chromo domain-containing protein [Aspergillus lucknowensis]|uniref:Chromo domain-containing protein n=1 Tax=Aspergillus lucknowensis TaxID=176173 RepID=A0ABR4M2W7_9EURO
MPPPVVDFSDDESSTGESIPYDNVQDKENGTGDVDDEEGDDEEEDVYVVEKIMGHSFKSDGTLMLQVKWQGYDDPKDQTLEPEENLVEGAKDVLDEYFRILGGRPEKPQRKKRKSMGRPPKLTPEKPAPRKRRKSRADTETDAAEGKEKDSHVPDWVPKSKNWENEVKAVDTIVREGDGLVAFLHWNNDKKSRVSIETCYEKCPRKMLKFYEQHLVFKDA